MEKVNNSNHKLVSIITPCYNSDKYINKLLDSVLIQNYPNVEMIVVDDGSNDESAKIIKSYINKFKDRKYSLFYIYQNNKGQSSAVNKALKLVKGDYLVWPDADDYYADREAISEMVKVLDDSNETVSMVRVQYNVLDESGCKIGHLGASEETKYKTDLFEDAVFGSNGFWYPPGGVMAKMSKIDELIPNRQIYTEKNTGQNFQLYLPLLYNQQCITIEEDFYNIINHSDSHSRNQSTNNSRQNAYYRTIKATLDRIDMPQDYYKYIIKKVKLMIRKAKMPSKSVIQFRTFIKKAIKALLPHGIIVILRHKGILKNIPPQVVLNNPNTVNLKTPLETMSDYDNLLFNNGYAHGDLNQSNIEGWLLFCSHVLEKAMSRVNFEEGHNFFRLEQMTELLNDYDRKGFDKKSFAYRYSLSSIKEYILLHQQYNFSTDKIKETLGDLYSKSINTKEKLSGYKIITRKDKLNNQTLNFAELQQNRYSVREFSPKSVNIDDIQKAIELSIKSPSVCNRQPIRVHLITNQRMIEQALKIQGGFGGYDIPTCLLLITADVRNYVGETERNQGFIDGGTFAMSLLLSLEYYGLASCPLHTMFTPETDREIRKIIGMNDPEYLIMFIAVGNFNEKNKVALSSRYTALDIVKEYI